MAEKVANETDVTECDQCDYKSSCKAGLNRHIGQKHKLIPQLDGHTEADNNLKISNCFFCDEKLQCKEQLMQHISTTCSEDMRMYMFSMRYGQMLKEKGLNEALKIAMADQKK